MAKFIINLSGFYHKTKTEISVNSNTKLSDLAQAICSSDLCNFEDELNDDSHMYGFTENLHSYFHSNPKFAKYIKTVDDYSDDEKDCAITNIDDVFTHLGKKMLFAFDFGTTINIIVKRIN